jgi:hypothetical protein
MWRFLLFDIAKRVGPAMAEEFSRARLRKALTDDTRSGQAEDGEARIARLEAELEQARSAISQMSEVLSKLAIDADKRLTTLYIWNVILTGFVLLGAVGAGYLLFLR